MQKPKDKVEFTPPFFMTLRPTADEIATATFAFTPVSADEVDVAAAEAANAMLRKMPEIKARIWHGSTNRGKPIEVAVLQILKMDEGDRVRLEEILKAGNLPSNFPEAEVGVKEDASEGVQEEEEEDAPIPIVMVVRVGEGEQQRFFIEACPFCGLHHYHSPEEGHRMPHCPVHLAPPRGYYLEEVKHGG